MLWPRWRAEFRQLRHHHAFRIAAAEGAPVFAELDRLLAGLDAVTTSAAPAPPRPEAPDGSAAHPSATELTLDDAVLVEAATNLWRAQRKLAQDSDASSRYTRPAGRYLGLCRESLKEIGLVVQDHDGDTYHPGRRLEVLAFEDDPAAETERVLRTVRPSIYFRERHLQTGQVIVGCPVAAGREEQGENRA